jgi:hypothetical protein
VGGSGDGCGSGGLLRAGLARAGERLVADVEGRLAVKDKGPFPAPLLEKLGRLCVGLGRAGLLGGHVGEVDRDDVPSIAAKQSRFVVRVEDVVGRGDEPREVTTDAVGVETQRTEGGDLRHESAILIQRSWQTKS